MKFRNKILIAIWSVVLGLIILTFVIMNYWMRVQVQERFASDLRRNYTTLHEINTLRADQDVKSCQIIAETPRLKAVAELGDRNTALQLSKELNQGVLANIFVLTNAKGTPIARLIDGKEVEFSVSNIQSIGYALRKESQADVWNIDADVYRGASSPILVGTDLVGTLTIGFRVKPEDMEFVKSLTNSEVLLAIDTLQVASTFSSMQHIKLADILYQGEKNISQSHSPTSAPVFNFETPNESYVAAFCRLDRISSPERTTVGYLLFRPIGKEVEATLNPLLNTLLVLSIIVLLITAIIGYIISNSITRPIAALVHGTAEIGRGNYDVHIDVKTGGELKFLAQKFEEMASSLKDKINQLAQQNIELQHALTQLKETQEERLRLATNLQLLLESTGEGIFGIDLEGHCTFINESRCSNVRLQSD